MVPLLLGLTAVVAVVFVMLSRAALDDARRTASTSPLSIRRGAWVVAQRTPARH